MMLRTAVSFACAVALLAPTAAFANDRHDRRDANRNRTIERVRTSDDNRNRTFERRDNRAWEQRDDRREVRRERDQRDRRYDRRDDRRGYGRDRYGERRIMIIPHFSF